MRTAADILIATLIVITLSYVGRAFAKLPDHTPKRSETPPYEWAIHAFAPRVIEWYCTVASDTGKRKLRKEVVGDTGHFVIVRCRK